MYSLLYPCLDRHAMLGIETICTFIFVIWRRLSKNTSSWRDFPMVNFWRVALHFLAYLTLTDTQSIPVLCFRATNFDCGACLSACLWLLPTAGLFCLDDISQPPLPLGVPEWLSSSQPSASKLTSFASWASSYVWSSVVFPLPVAILEATSWKQRKYTWKVLESLSHS